MLLFLANAPHCYGASDTRATRGRRDLFLMRSAHRLGMSVAFAERRNIRVFVLSLRQHFRLGETPKFIFDDWTYMRDQIAMPAGGEQGVDAHPAEAFFA